MNSHLVYANRATLFAVPFDLEHLEKRGNPVESFAELLRADLDGYGAAEARVMRAVDLSHPALAEQALNLVRSQFGPGCQR